VKEAIRHHAGFPPVPWPAWAPEPKPGGGEPMLCPKSGEKRNQLALGCNCRRRHERVSIGSTHKIILFLPVLWL